MKRKVTITALLGLFFYCVHLPAQTQTKTVKKGVKYDTIIVKHQPPAVKKPAAKPPVVAKPVEIVIPTPEYINQPYYYDPYYYDKDGNKIIKLENANAIMATKKKTLGLKGAKQTLTMDANSSRTRFMAKKDIVFILKTSGDVIDLTSYIKLYQFVPVDQKREVTINAKDGLLNDKDEARGKLINFSVKMISPDNYMVQLPDQLDAGEYGFVWVKNMELKEFVVYAFGIDWKSID
jgi:hypothetical protein